MPDAYRTYRLEHQRQELATAMNEATIDDWRFITKAALDIGGFKCL